VGSVVFPVVHGLPLLGVVTMDPELNVENPLMIVHGEQEIIHHRPTRPGDALVFTPSLVSVEDKGKGFLARHRRHPDGNAVNEQSATISCAVPEVDGTTCDAAPAGGARRAATFTRHVAVGCRPPTPPPQSTTTRFISTTP
jgi:hypothetical protein